MLIVLLLPILLSSITVHTTPNTSLYPILRNSTTHNILLCPNSLSNVSSQSSCWIYSQSISSTTVFCTNVASFDYMLIPKQYQMEISYYSLHFFDSAPKYHLNVSSGINSVNTPVVLSWVTGVKADQQPLTSVSLQQVPQGLVVRKSQKVTDVNITYVVIMVNAVGNVPYSKEYQFGYLTSVREVKMQDVAKVQVETYYIRVYENNNCSYGIVVFETQSIVGVSYCIVRANISRRSKQTPIVNKNNSNDIFQYNPPGCQSPYVVKGTQIGCSSCQKGFTLFSGSCICNARTRLLNNDCVDCTNCTLTPLINITLQQNVLTFTLQFPNYVAYLTPLQQYVLPTILCNQILYPATAYWVDPFTVQLQLTIPSSKQYLINAVYKGPILITTQKQSFYISFDSERLYRAPLSVKNVASSVKKVVQNKAVPFIFAVAYFVGDKINLMSVLQTSSILYLSVLMNCNNSIKLKSIVSSIFLFAPKLLFNITLNMNKINSNYVMQNQFNQYTNGDTAISYSISYIMIIILQIICLQCILSLLLYCLSRPSNQIQPSQLPHDNRYTTQIIRYTTLSSGFLHWLPHPILQNPTLRHRIFYKLTYFYQKRLLNITSFLLPYLPLFTLICLNSLTTQFYSIAILLNSLYSFVILSLILSYPCLLLTYNSLHLLKAVKVISKRTVPLSHAKIWLFFTVQYFEGVYSAGIVFANDWSAVTQGIFLALYQIMKVVVMNRAMKVLDGIKCVSVAVYFLSVGLSEEVSVCAMIIVVGIEGLKIVKGVIKGVISLFKGKDKIKREEFSESKVQGGEFSESKVQGGEFSESKVQGGEFNGQYCGNNCNNNSVKGKVENKENNIQELKELRMMLEEQVKHIRSKKMKTIEDKYKNEMYIKEKSSKQEVQQTKPFTQFKRRKRE